MDYNSFRINNNFIYSGFIILNEEYVIYPNEVVIKKAKKELKAYFNLSELNEPFIENNGFRDAIVFKKRS